MQQILIKDVKNMRGSINVIGKIHEKNNPQTINKRNGTQTLLCNAVLEDASGQIDLALWGQDGFKISVGNMVQIQNGFTSMYLGKVVLSPGFWGKLIVEQLQKPKPYVEVVHLPQKPDFRISRIIRKIARTDNFETQKMWRQYWRESLS